MSDSNPSASTPADGFDPGFNSGFNSGSDAGATGAAAAQASAQTVASARATPTHLSAHWVQALGEACQPMSNQPGRDVVVLTQPPPARFDLTRFDLIARMADSEDCWDAVRDHLMTLPAQVVAPLAFALARHLPASLSPLLAFAQHPDPEVRSNAVMATKAVGMDRSAPLLLAVMEQVEDPVARENWYEVLSLVESRINDASGNTDVPVSLTRALASQIAWQERHSGLGISTDLMQRCVTAVSRQPRTLPRSHEVSATLAGWLADTACQRLPYMAYDTAPDGTPKARHRVAPMTDSERQINTEVAARLAAHTLANGNIRTQEALYETATYVSTRDWSNESARANRNATLAAGALCMSEAGIPGDGCVDLDLAERFVRQCTDGDQHLRQILAMALMAHLLRRPEERTRAMGLLGDVVAVPPEEIRGNLTSELLLLLRGLGPDFVERPDVKRVYEAAAEMWIHVAIEVIAWADQATLRRVTKAWRRKSLFPRVLAALVKRGVPVFSNDQAFRITQSPLIDRTQAILAAALTMDVEGKPAKAALPPALAPSSAPASVSASTPSPRKV